MSRGMEVQYANNTCTDRRNTITEKEKIYQKRHSMCQNLL